MLKDQAGRRRKKRRKGERRVPWVSGRRGLFWGQQGRVVPGDERKRIGSHGLPRSSISSQLFEPLLHPSREAPALRALRCQKGEGPESNTRGQREQCQAEHAGCSLALGIGGHPGWV